MLFSGQRQQRQICWTWFGVRPQTRRCICSCLPLSLFTQGTLPRGHGLPRRPRSDMVTRDTTHRLTRSHRHNPSTTQPPFATRTTRASQEAVMQPNTVLPHVQNMDSRNCKQRLYRCMRSRYSKQTLMPRGHRKHVKAVRPCARTTNPQAHALVL